MDVHLVVIDEINDKLNDINSGFDQYKLDSKDSKEEQKKSILLVRS